VEGSHQQILRRSSGYPLVFGKLLCPFDLSSPLLYSPIPSTSTLSEQTWLAKRKKNKILDRLFAGTWEQQMKEKNKHSPINLPSHISTSSGFFRYTGVADHTK
jgi:hypothetical protein